MATADQKRQSDLSKQAIALAEQLGRVAGTVEGTAEAWLNRQQLTEQLAKVRDGAARMLESLRKTDRKAAPSARPRPADPSRAAGKRRRKPAPTVRGVKKSDERISKMRTAAKVRQRRKSYA